MNPSGCVGGVPMEHHEHVFEQIVLQQSLNTNLHARTPTVKNDREGVAVQDRKKVPAMRQVRKYRWETAEVVH